MNKHLTSIQILVIAAALVAAGIVLGSSAGWGQPLGLEDPLSGPPMGPPPFAGERDPGVAGPIAGPPPWAPRLGPGNPGRMPDLWDHPEIQKKLGLTEEQVKKLQEKRFGLETKRIEVNAQTEIARLTLENLVNQEEIDKASIEEQIKKLGELHGEQVRGMVDQKLALREILNADQLKKVDDFLARLKSRRAMQGDRGPAQIGERFRDLRDRAEGRRDREEALPDRPRRGEGERERFMEGQKDRPERPGRPEKGAGWKGPDGKQRRVGPPPPQPEEGGSGTEMPADEGGSDSAK